VGGGRSFQLRDYFHSGLKPLPLRGRACPDMRSIFWGFGERSVRRKYGSLNILQVLKLRRMPQGHANWKSPLWDLGVELYSSLPPILDYGNITNITFDGKPPSQPSPRGEGAKELPA